MARNHTGGAGKSPKTTLGKIGAVLIHPASLTIAGFLASVLVGYFFYEKGKSDVVDQAIEDGRKDGHAQGLQQALEAFERNLPKLVEERYPGAVEQAKSLGRAEGREEGREEGRTAGKNEGLAEGREKGLEEGRASGYDAGYATVWLLEIKKDTGGARRTGSRPED